MSGDWRGTLWPVLVTFWIVIIMCIETFWSPCRSMRKCVSYIEAWMRGVSLHQTELRYRLKLYSPAIFSEAGRHQLRHAYGIPTEILRPKQSPSYSCCHHCTQNGSSRGKQTTAKEQQLMVDGNLELCSSASDTSRMSFVSSHWFFLIGSKKVAQKFLFLITK
jgi:hypothetical protein